MPPTTEPTQNKLLLNIPIAIIIAGAIVAGAVIWTKKPIPVAPVVQEQLPGTVGKPIRAVTDKDHILGSPTAPIKIVEYSDPSCPFCKAFHVTMRKLMEEYGKSGQVAWIYRSFPLDFHPNAIHESQALECAAKLGGNDKFWTFTNRLYEITPSVTADTPDGLDQSQLAVIATYSGIDKTSFNACLGSGETKSIVDADQLDGVNAGISGTPTSFIVGPSGKQITISGAQPYSKIKGAIDALLTSTEQ